MNHPQVKAELTEVSYPTYPVGLPERNPMFFEKRVYQGSSGKVYPVPFIDRISDEAGPQVYQAARIENEFVRLLLLPEIGGRIHVAQDKTANDYDIFYRQDTIKPALVGLAGPWVSGGVEFNWPQHHRPGTFLPTDSWIEEEPSGARTIWLSEHDPLKRLKGMHGVRLRPGSALIELRARLFNRTPVTQTFLWWANAAVRVHERYQSFFPPDARYVADHAKRSVSTFPVATGVYYGVNYGDRPGANDLTWYKNIPVPTSYMIVDSRYDFYGGYDYAHQAGFVHVANRHIAPGKKQWTWGNHEFGRAWDRELSDDGAPYIELMTGVYTDNQPDFSYLAPYETRTFSHYWWPIQRIGPVQNANTRAALRLVVDTDRRIDLGAAVPTAIDGAWVTLRQGDRVLLQQQVSIEPGRPWSDHSLKFTGTDPAELELQLVVQSGAELIAYRPERSAASVDVAAAATEPFLPDAVDSAEELFLIGEHLDQYRHPTRNPEDYWTEALRRDPLDARSHLGLARQCLERAQFEQALEHCEAANRRLTRWHPNPCTGEGFYYAGVAQRFLDRCGAAYDAFYRATWDYAWRGPAFYELALLDCRAGRWSEALIHLERALETNTQNGHAVVLRATLLRLTGRESEARSTLAEWLHHDPLDHWARFESARVTGNSAEFLRLSRNDAQTIIDLAFNYSDAGLGRDALALLDLHHGAPVPVGATPNPLARTAMTSFVEAWIATRAGDDERATRALAEAQSAPPDFLFPSRPREAIVLAWALQQPGSPGNAAFGLGNLLYDFRRHEEAITCWERATGADPAFPTAFRNLGIAYWNVRRDGERARHMYLTAFTLDPSDARILFEYDQLRKKLNDPPEERLDFLLTYPKLIDHRDDLTVELAALYNLLGRSDDALTLLENRRFHPWEGGEGQVLRQYAAARLQLGIRALAAGDAERSCRHLAEALEPPANLGETHHLHQARADLLYWKGRAHAAAGDDHAARACFEASASERGDFQRMSVTEHSQHSFYRGASLIALGRQAEARRLFEELARFAERKRASVARIDYFATSLPLLLVFEDDLQARNDWEALYLSGLAQLGLGRIDVAVTCFEQVVAAHRAHADARRFLSELQKSPDGALRAYSR